MKPCQLCQRIEWRAVDSCKVIGPQAAAYIVSSRQVVVDYLMCEYCGAVARKEVIESDSAGTLAVGESKSYSAGDVFQITEKYPRAGWIGAFVLATEVYGWGIQGFVAAIETHEKQAQVPIRLPWDQIEYVGRSVLSPAQEKADG